MNTQGLVSVALDKELTEKLLNGLYNGAEGKALKVLIDTDGNYHITSKGLEIFLEIDTTSADVKRITVSNEKYFCEISDTLLGEMGLLSYANSAGRILRERYSPYFHSLADNIVLFSRAYWNN